VDASSGVGFWVQIEVQWGVEIEVVHIPIDEIGICEEGNVLFDIERSLIDEILGRGNRVEVCDILGHVRSVSAMVARHCACCE